MATGSHAIAASFTLHLHFPWLHGWNSRWCKAKNVIIAGVQLCDCCRAQSLSQLLSCEIFHFYVLFLSFLHLLLNCRDANAWMVKKERRIIRVYQLWMHERPRPTAPSAPEGQLTKTHLLCSTAGVPQDLLHLLMVTTRRPPKGLE